MKIIGPTNDECFGDPDPKIIIMGNSDDFMKLANKFELGEKILLADETLDCAASVEISFTSHDDEYFSTSEEKLELRFGPVSKKNAIERLRSLAGGAGSGYIALDLEATDKEDFSVYIEVPPNVRKAL